jgi:hypothetical protein
LIVLALLLFTPPILTQSPEEGQKRVLVFYSLRKGMPIQDISERALQKNLSAGLAGHLDYYNEYIEVVRFPDPQYQVLIAWISSHALNTEREAPQ